MSYGLTPSLRRVLDAIEAWIEQVRISPTLRELAQILDRESRGNLSANIRDLAVRGWIRYRPGKHRSIELVRGARAHVDLAVAPEDEATEELEFVGLFDAPHLFTARDLAAIDVLRREQSPPLEESTS